MVGAFIVATVVGQVTPTKLSFRDGAFVVSGASGNESVKLSTPSKSDPAVNRAKRQFLLKSGDVSVHFGTKGLTIRDGKRVTVTRLNGVPTSGKIATKESNAELMDLVSKKERSLAVSALSGYEMVDKTLYLLARWEDKGKSPWLEALVKVDLDKSPVKAELIRKLDGLSFAQGAVDDVLFLRGKNLAVLSNTEGHFGLTRIPLDDAKPDFEALGDAVGKAKLSEDGSSAWTLTPTAYGTNIVGIADLDQSSYHVVSEFRGKMTEIQHNAFALYKVGPKQRVINLQTGALTEVEPSSVFCPTGQGVLVYSPAENPIKAQLLDSQFRRLADWSAPADLVASRSANKRKPVPTAAPAKTTAKKVATASNAKKKPEVTKATAPPKKTVPTGKTSAKTAPKKVTATTGKTGKGKRAKPVIEIEVQSRPSKKKG